MYHRLYIHFQFNLLNKRPFIINKLCSLSRSTKHEGGISRDRLPYSIHRLPYSIHRFNNVPTFNPTRLLHKTEPKSAIPPFIIAILRSAIQVLPIVAGRGVRNWWMNLPGEKREHLLRKFKEQRSRIIRGGIFCGGLSYLYYFMHLVEDPIMKRKKFIIVSDKELEEMSVIESNKIIQNYRKQIVMSGQQYDYLLRITKTILKANRALPGAKRTWQVILIDDIQTQNAFVLPSGHIFVFSGMIAQTSNEDQLATIVGHEIAHVLLRHSAESFSKAYFTQLLLLIPFILFWALFPDNVASNSQRITQYMSNVLFSLPFSRKLESEADILGLEMMARACYDPRQAGAFWRKIDQISKDKQIEWLSTHPSHKSRYETLDRMTSNVLRIRAKYCFKKDSDRKDPPPTDK